MAVWELREKRGNCTVELGTADADSPQAAEPILSHQDPSANPVGAPNPSSPRPLPDPPQSGGPAAWPLHPFLLAAYSVVWLYASNLRETAFGDTVVAVAMTLFAALALVLVFALARRRLEPRAAVLASIVLVVGLFYSDLLSWLDRLLPDFIPASADPPIVFGLAGLLLLSAWAAPFRMILPNALLNGVALVLLIVPAVKAASYEWETIRPGDAPILAEASAAAGGSADLPDIYYLIFDRYASQETLGREFGFDNSAILSYLRDKGFYVASRSHANYLKTAPSLASTFQMDYINALAHDKRAARGDWRPVYDMLEEHRVAQFLKDKGYRFIQIGAWWNPTEHNSFADENFSFGFSEFNWLFLQRTILPPLLNAFAPASRLSRQMQWDNAQCQRVPAQIAKVKEIARRPEATFVFAHILLPHEPFVFDADGRCRSQGETIATDFESGYLGQVKYANTLIRDFVSTLLETSAHKPVIIIQADEGPFPERYRFGNRSWRDATTAELRMKMGILNAYFFPGGDYSALFPSITPVNSFRVLFNTLFQAKFGLLPDRMYAFPDVMRIYDFFEITSIVEGIED